MTEFNILDFLRTGEFKEFPYGTDIRKVVDAFGETTWTVPISKKDKRPAILKYDQTEFYFHSDNDQKLKGIQITYSEPGDKARINTNYGPLKEALNYDEIKSLLTSQAIAFSEKSSPYDNETNVIETDAHVIFFFEDRGVVQKFGRFIH